MLVKLISSYGHEFTEKRCPFQALFKLCCPGQFAENETSEVNFREIPKLIIKKSYLHLIYVGFPHQPENL